MGRPSHKGKNSFLVSHCKDTADIMRYYIKSSFGTKYHKFGEHMCSIIGLTHDILKDTDMFEAHLKENRPKNEYTRHTGGSALIGMITAKELMSTWDFQIPLPKNMIPKLVFSVILGHHGELKQTALKKEHKDSITQWLHTSGQASKDILGELGIDYNYVKGEVQGFMEGGGIWPREKVSCDEYFISMVLARLFLGALGFADEISASGGKGFYGETCLVPEVPFPKDAPDTDMNRARTAFQRKILANCDGKGMYIVKAPTGIGKTIGVIRCLGKIQQGTPSKVFYVAPTVTILGQVSNVLDGLGIDHTEIHYMAPEDEYRSWDSGFIVTTYHRIINLLSGLSKQECKRLHDLRGSIFILDECQALSDVQYPLFMSIVNVMSELCDCSFVFMSATTRTENEYRLSMGRLGWDSIEPVKILCGEVKLPPRVKTVPVEIRDIETLASNIMCRSKGLSTLVILNLANDCLELERQLASLGKKADYCITGYLRPKDIKKQLQEALERLRRGEPILMVATSIVQAGLDLDFDLGFIDLNEKALFIQGCGRIGRVYNERRGLCEVNYFELKDKNQRSSWFRQRYWDIKDGYIGQMQLQQARNTELEIAQLCEEEIKGKEILDVKKFLFNGPFGCNVENCMGNDRKMGFEYHKVERLLDPNLYNGEEVKPIGVFYRDNSNDMDVLDNLINKAKCLGNIEDENLDFWEKIRMKRNVSKSIDRGIAPYLVRKWEGEVDVSLELFGYDICVK